MVTQQERGVGDEEISKSNPGFSWLGLQEPQKNKIEAVS